MEFFMLLLKEIQLLSRVSFSYLCPSLPVWDFAWLSLEINIQLLFFLVISEVNIRLYISLVCDSVASLLFRIVLVMAHLPERCLSGFSPHQNFFLLMSISLTSFFMVFSINFMTSSNILYILRIFSFVWPNGHDFFPDVQYHQSFLRTLLSAPTTSSHSTSFVTLWPDSCIFLSIRLLLFSDFDLLELQYSLDTSLGLKAGIV